MPTLAEVKDRIKRSSSEMASLRERESQLEKEMKDVKAKLSKLKEEQSRLKAEAFDLMEKELAKSTAASPLPPLVKKTSRYSIGSNGSLVSASSSSSSSASSVSSSSGASYSSRASSVSTAPSSVASERPRARADDAVSILPNPWEGQRPRQALRTASSHASLPRSEGWGVRSTSTQLSSEHANRNSSDSPIYTSPPVRSTGNEYDPTHIAPYYPATVVQQRTLSLAACAWLSEQWDLQHTGSESPRAVPPKWLALCDRMWAQTKWKYVTDEIKRAWEVGQWRFRISAGQVGGPPFQQTWTPRAEEHYAKRQAVLDRLRKMGHLKDLPKPAPVNV